MTRFAMALGALAFLWTIPAAATGTGYQKYISQYAGDYLHQFGQGSGYQDYIQTYTGMKSGAQTEEDTQPISLMADMSEGHTDKQEPAGTALHELGRTVCICQWCSSTLRKGFSNCAMTECSNQHTHHTKENIHEERHTHTHTSRTH